jgi:hypothetical protein
VGGLRHAAYASGWKKFERLWHALIRVRQLACALPALEAVLTAFGRLAPAAENPTESFTGGELLLRETPD